MLAGFRQRPRGKAARVLPYNSLKGEIRGAPLAYFNASEAYMDDRSGPRKPSRRFAQPWPKFRASSAEGSRKLGRRFAQAWPKVRASVAEGSRKPYRRFARDLGKVHAVLG